jgi:hypothetical protein
MFRAEKGGKKSYAKRVAFGVAHCFMGVLSDSIPPMVAAADFRCGILFVGMVTTTAKGTFTVANYPVPAS